MQEQLQLLNQISDELNKDLDLDNMLQRVIDLTVAHFRSATGSIILFDDQRRVSKYILQQRDISDDRAHRIVGQVLTEGFAGWVLENGTGDVIIDTIEDKRWFNYPNQPYKARSVIATPLSRRNRVLGVLTMTHEVPGHFTKEDLSVLNAITGQAAIALENAQLFYQTELERNTLSAIISGTQDAIIVVDPESHEVSLMNPAAEKLLKVVPGGWQGATLEAINRIDALTAIASEPPDPEEEQELRLSEDQTLQPSVVDVPNVGRLILLHDISALKALDKMKSEFVLTFTHDLAAPLAAIKGYLELMRIDGALTERQEEDLDSIRMSVDQMRNLITDLQELSRLETLKNMVRRNISLNDTLQKTVDTFQPIAETKAIRLILNPSDESLVTYGNPALIARAVDNLVENAIKYTRAQGQVGVSLSGDHGEVLIIVKDTGIGIPTKKLSNIFEKFFRAHPPSENEIPGSGLGLSIVKTIVERHGGRIWVESEVDVGSTFTIALPRHQNGSVG